MIVQNTTYKQSPHPNKLKFLSLNFPTYDVSCNCIINTVEPLITDTLINEHLQ
jgi:hypothetical protein